MIRHVVTCKLNEKTDQSRLNEIVDELRKLPDIIEEIIFYQVGIDVLRRPNSADFVVVSDFETLETLEDYRNHPAHRKVVDELLLPVLDRMTAVDFEWRP